MAVRLWLRESARKRASERCTRGRAPDTCTTNRPAGAVRLGLERRRGPLLSRHDRQGHHSLAQLDRLLRRGRQVVPRGTIPSERDRRASVAVFEPCWLRVGTITEPDSNCQRIQSNPIQSNPIQSNPIQSNPIQSNPQSMLSPLGHRGAHGSWPYVIEWLVLWAADRVPRFSDREAADLCRAAAVRVRQRVVLVVLARWR